MPGIDGFTTSLLHLDWVDGGPYAYDEIGGRAWACWNGLSGTGRWGNSANFMRYGGTLWMATFDASVVTFSSAWCIDLWVYQGNLNSRLWVIDTFGSYSMFLQYGAGGGWTWGIDYGTQYGFSGALSAGWNHVAACCDGTYWRLFLNGIQLSSTQTALAQPRTPQAFAYGTLGSTLSNGVDAYVDECRISAGTPRWTSNFNPPTAPYNNVFDGNPVSVTPYIMAIKKYRQLYNKLIQQGAVSLGRRELLPI